MTTTVDVPELFTEAKCYRLRRYYLILGVLCAIFFAAIGGFSTAAAYFNLDGSFPRPVLAAIIFAVFWSGFMLLSLWIVAAYFRERLILDSSEIVQHGVFRVRTLEVAEVCRIKWRNRPVGGSIVVRTELEKITIYLNNFTKDERKEIVLFFREIFVDEIQEGGLQFDECARNLFLAKKRSAVLETVMPTVLMLFAGLFAYCWFTGLGAQFLFLSFVNAVVGLWQLWRTRVAKQRRLMEEAEVVGR
jgi:hypothetical protein